MRVFVVGFTPYFLISSAFSCAIGIFAHWAMPAFLSWLRKVRFSKTVVGAGFLFSLV
jgi:hypothetical protein